MAPIEELLTGGNTTQVVRRGNTVHRAAGPWTPTVHRLLSHLRFQGLEWVPAPIGFDERGREMLTYLVGTVPLDPMPAWAWSDPVLVDAARHLAQLHDATVGYRDRDAVWQLPAREPREVICHNDFVSYNMVFDDDRRLVGVFDWDTAWPGPRVWDLAYLAYRLVPLSAPTNPDGLPSPIQERRRRLAILCEAYGSLQSSSAVVAAAVERLTDLAEFTARRAADGATHVASHVQGYYNDAAWLSANLVELAGGRPVNK